MSASIGLLEEILGLQREERDRKTFVFSLLGERIIQKGNSPPRHPESSSPTAQKPALLSK